MARKGDNSKALKTARAGGEVHELAPPAKDELRLPRKKASHASGATDPDAVAQAQRTRTILQYRVMGATLQQIADKFDLTPGRVHQIIAAAVEALPKQAAEDVKRLELERLDAMQFALWPAALKGDIGAITTVLSIMTRRARYLGLDEPEQPGSGEAAVAAAEDARNALLGRLLTMQERLKQAGAQPALPSPDGA